MIQYLQHEEINQLRWDVCISQSSNGLVYGFSWYLNVVSPKWGALIYGDYEAVMPLTGKKKFTIHYLSQPFFTQQLGIFFKGTLSPEIMVAFIQAIPSKYRFIEINLNAYNKPIKDELPLGKRKNYLLPLNRPYDKILKGYHSQAKRNIKAAKKTL